jgi:hypothetical protein
MTVGPHAEAFRLRHGRARYVAAGAGLAVVAVVWTLLALPPGDDGSVLPSGDAGSAPGRYSALVQLSAAPLGVNTASWDSIYSAFAHGLVRVCQFHDRGSLSLAAPVAGGLSPRLRTPLPRSDTASQITFGTSGTPDVSP